MTLIVTAVGKSVVIQVSDRRLTTPSGALYDDNANKAVCVACRDAVFTIAYTGLAQIGSKRIDEWLADELTEMKASYLPFIELWMALKGRLDPTFNNLRIDRKRRGLVLVMAGYRPVPKIEGPLKNFEGQVTGFAGQLSNIDDDAAKPLPKPDNEFHWHSWWSPDVKELKRFTCLVHGTERAVSKNVMIGLDRVSRRALTEAPETTARRYVYLIRRTAKDEKYGGRIGKNCMSVVVTPTGHFSAVYHPEKQSSISYAPHFITASFSFKDISFQRGGQPRRRKS